MSKIRVFIADDHSIVREGLRNLLATQSDMEFAGEAADGMEAVKKIKILRPDVAVIDIVMPLLSGLDSVRLIKDNVPQTEIVVLSMYNKEAFVYEAISSGALGYVLKAAPSLDVLTAIRSAKRGEYFLSSKISAEIICGSGYLKDKKQKSSVRCYDLLTEREQQIFRLVVEGNSTKKIANILCVSPKTVEKHRSNIIKKLGVDGTLGLVKYAMKIKVIDPEIWGY